MKLNKTMNGLTFLIFVLLLGMSGTRSLKAEDFLISSVNGNSAVIPAKTSHASPVKKGLLLQPGDRLVTSKNGKMEIASQNGSLFHLPANSSLTFRKSNSKETIFFLKVGRFIGKFMKMGGSHVYRIKTPVAVAAIRGTEVMLAADENGIVQAGVMEGKVGFQQCTDQDQEEDQIKPELEESTAEIMVEKNQGVVVGEDKKIIKTLDVPSLCVNSMPVMEDLRKKFPTVREIWKDFDRPAHLALRDQSLRESIQWRIPEKIKPPRIKVPSNK